MSIHIDIADHGFRAKMMALALSLLLFISVFQGIVSLLDGAWLLVCLFGAALFVQTKALLSLQSNTSNRKTAYWAVVLSWLSLIYGFSIEYLMTLYLPILLSLCAYFILPSAKANIVNGLAWLGVGFMALSGTQALGIEAIMTIAGVLVLANVVMRHLSVLETEIEKTQVTDSSTGCLNKDALIREMEKSWEIYKRYDIHASTIKLTILDLNRLQNELGLSQANVLLNEVVQVWISRLRNTDILCRYDDTQFICLLPNTPQESAELLAADLCKACDEYEFSGAKDIRIVSSVAQCLHEESWETWLRAITLLEGNKA